MVDNIVYMEHHPKKQRDTGGHDPCSTQTCLLAANGRGLPAARSSTVLIPSPGNRGPLSRIAMCRMRTMPSPQASAPSKTRRGAMMVSCAPGFCSVSPICSTGRHRVSARSKAGTTARPLSRMSGRRSLQRGSTGILLDWPTRSTDGSSRSMFRTHSISRSASLMAFARCCLPGIRLCNCLRTSSHLRLRPATRSSSSHQRWRRPLSWNSGSWSRRRDFRAASLTSSPA